MMKQGHLTDVLEKTEALVVALQTAEMPNVALVVTGIVVSAAIPDSDIETTLFPQIISWISSNVDIDGEAGTYRLRAAWPNTVE